MISVASFVRRMPQDLLTAYLSASGLAPSADFKLNGMDACKRVSQLFAEAAPALKAHCLKDWERIAALTDEAGQVALLSTTQSRASLDALPSGYARSCWAFLNDTTAFRHAEEVRFSDEHRRGRKWTGVVTTPQLSVRTTPQAIARFEEGVRRELGSEHVQLDIFERRRESFDHGSFEIIQVTVYRDGLPEDLPEFADGKLSWRSYRPVYEAALTFEPASGVIEVVANNRDSRENLLKLFAKELLGTSDHDALPFRRFNLDRLLRPHEFPTDPDDGIESVRVTTLRLQPFDDRRERITLECNSPEPKAIWHTAERHLGRKNSLLVGFTVTRAKLVIRMRSSGTARRGKTLPLTISMPHGCDLKDRTADELVIGEKYLRRWKLLANE